MSDENTTATGEKPETPMIPKPRFDEVLQEREALRTKLNQIEEDPVAFSTQVLKEYGIEDSDLYGLMMAKAGFGTQAQQQEATKALTEAGVPASDQKELVALFQQAQARLEEQGRELSDLKEFKKSLEAAQHESTLQTFFAKHSGIEENLELRGLLADIMESRRITDPEEALKIAERSFGGALENALSAKTKKEPALAPAAAGGSKADQPDDSGPYRDEKGNPITDLRELDQIIAKKYAKRRV